MIDTLLHWIYYTLTIFSLKQAFVIGLIACAVLGAVNVFPRSKIINVILIIFCLVGIFGYLSLFVGLYIKYL